MVLHGYLYTSLKPNSRRHSSRMFSSSATPMPPYELGSLLSLLTCPAKALPNAPALLLASAASAEGFCQQQQRQLFQNRVFLSLLVLCLFTRIKPQGVRMHATFSTFWDVLPGPLQKALAPCAISLHDNQTCCLLIYCSYAPLPPTRGALPSALYLHGSCTVSQVPVEDV